MRADSGDHATRIRVVDAAVDCILDQGFYRASSNQIARRAGVTWGVIQHHFGTREELLLAVLRRDHDRLAADLSGAEITGRTTAERLAALADLVWSYYGRPAYVATLQIQLNLSRDPQCAPETVDAMIDLQDRARDAWARLVDEVAGDTALPPVLGRVVLRVLRDMAVGDAVARGGPERVRDRMPSPEQLLGDRQVVVASLAGAIDAERPPGAGP